ncbi:adenosylcobinamide amidohydrolase [Alkalicoccus daliensis]|uniref:Iron complex transport system ATP-binding protein n=1 Tax=Alkalicoccus daliensis TaxID=745820 RepID=A0A1H0HYS5_9BACI|nr:adenosylcobinamide amidohydrolase [Alkalicoccus daliensis]SDO24284.1 iron complex transport system ATP-binding protein [Alkalicoccus daliensis]
MIEIKGLSGGYEKLPVIQQLNVKVNTGEFFGLLGPNGSGKTTLFKLMSGVLPAKEGTVTLHGKSLLNMNSFTRARHIAVLAQETNISFDFTVEEIVQLGRYAFQKGIFKTLSKYDKQLMEEVMEITDVVKYRHKPFLNLSGGEKQRVLLAKALVQEPEVLLLDEPTNHLDIKHTFEILDLLKRWQEERQLTIFAILHDLNIAALYCDRVGLLHQGALEEVGTVDVLRKRKKLAEIYGVETWTQPHPTLARPQLLMNPHKKKEQPVSLLEAYQLKQNEEVIRLSFPKPLRTISNGVAGEGIQWIKHFANFHVDKNYDCETPQLDVESWLQALELPVEQSIGMMTAVKVENAVIKKEVLNGIAILVVVTAGTGNAVDITHRETEIRNEKIGTINTLVFADVHLTDGGLVNACMSATEAKVKALHDNEITDGLSGTPATSTSTDSLVIAATQQGERTPYAGSGTFIGRGIGYMVYEATSEALQIDKRWKEAHS